MEYLKFISAASVEITVEEVEAETVAVAEEEVEREAGAEAVALVG